MNGIVERPMGKSKAKMSRHKGRAAPGNLGPKAPHPAKGAARPALKELAKEFAERRTAVDDRSLTPLQRRMLSGGA